LTRRRHERAAADVRIRARQQAERDRSLQLELDRVLDLVPEVYREPLVLHYLEGLSLEQSAELMECPVGTVASRLARGREILRVRLERWGLGLTVATGGGLLLHEIGVEGFVATVVAPAGPVSATGGMTAIGVTAERSTLLAISASSTAALTTAGVLGICTRETVGLYGFGAGFGGSGAVGMHALVAAGACGSLAVGVAGSSALAASTMGAATSCGKAAVIGVLAPMLKSVASMAVTFGVVASAVGGMAVYHAANQAESAPSARVRSAEANENHDPFRDFRASSGGAGLFGGTSAVPEPGSMAMLMVSSLALLLRRRRQDEAR
jgi:RNA polymerase sigma-70 factor (ECF subfamily)